MTFTYDLNTTIGIIRFKIGDTTNGNGPRPDGRNFSDEEIQAALTDGVNVEGAVGVLSSVLAQEWAKVPDFKVGGRTQSMSQVSKMFDVRSQQSGVGTHTSFTTVFRRVDGYTEDVS